MALYNQYPLVMTVTVQFANWNMAIERYRKFVDFPMFIAW
jgi:hypothetical protein